MIAVLHEQADTPDVQDDELAELQRGAQAPRLSDDLVRPRHDVGGRADGQARAAPELQRRGHPELPEAEGPVRHGAEADDRVRRIRPVRAAATRP